MYIGGEGAQGAEISSENLKNIVKFSLIIIKIDIDTFFYNFHFSKN